jgi:hypothetical protein
MTVGLSKLAGVERLTAWKTKYTYVQLHVGDPGAAGTSNVATTSTRKAVTWGTPNDAVAGSVSLTHSNELSWTMAATEDPSHVSHWSASSGGDFGGSGQVIADPVTVGNVFALPAGTVVVNQPVAA